jgi:hypothetical protein
MDHSSLTPLFVLCPRGSLYIQDITDITVCQIYHPCRPYFLILRFGDGGDVILLAAEFTANYMSLISC